MQYKRKYVALGQSLFLVARCDLQLFAKTETLDIILREPLTER
jgi:hypothetical protein